jgi:peptide/nickel transport system ATP-binding protein
MALLDVKHLSVQLQTRQGPATAVRDLSFTLARGETLGLVGESWLDR